MNKITGLFALVMLSFGSAQAQDRMYEKDIMGTWKMIIDIDEVMNKLDKEATDSEWVLAELLLESVSGIAEGVMDNIDIYIDINRGGDATIMVDAFDAWSENEDTEWYIKNNRLCIANTKNFNSDKEGYWVMRDDVLFFENHDGDDEVTVYMVRVDN